MELTRRLPHRKGASTRTALKYIGSIAALGLVAFNARFLLRSVLKIPSFDLTISISERDLVLLIGVALLGLRWFVAHRKPNDKDKR